MGETDPTPTARAERRQKPQPKAGASGHRGLVALAGLAVVIGVVVWLLVRGGGDDTVATPEPVAASTGDLQKMAGDVAHPVYWAGERPGSTYELTKTADGRVYIRYLPKGVEVGDPSPKFTTVATYPQRNAYVKTQQAAQRPGAESFDTQSGALVVTNSASPTSVYFAFKGEPFLVEVFDPSPKKALDLALSGKILRLQPQS